MKISILSDLHLEYRCIFKTISRLYIPKSDLIVLVGNIGRLDTNEELYKYDKFLTHLNLYKIGNTPVLLIPGNHEYYGFEKNKENCNETLIQICKKNNINFLQNQIFKFSKDINILGTTLYTPKCDKEEFEKSFKFLKENNDYNNIIATHFLPYIPKYLFLNKCERYKDFIGTDILSYLNYKAIIHGYNHYNYKKPEKVFSNSIKNHCDNFTDIIKFEVIEV
jgi:predicted phosphodiesterase